jgi:peptide/nickel transport system substrate-binding protein
MCFIGWSPGTFDAEDPILFLARTPTVQLGTRNSGSCSNARVNALLPLIQQDINPASRQAMTHETVAIMQDEVAYAPLYVEAA